MLCVYRHFGSERDNEMRLRGPRKLNDAPHGLGGSHGINATS
jgi:hypothetical protein